LREVVYVEVLILSGARTPFGKLGGALRSFTAVELGAMATKAAMQKIELDPTLVDEVYMGSAMLVGGTSVAARQMLPKAGLPLSTPSLTIDRACCSSMTCVGLAVRSLLLGDARVVIAGGFESMSNTPYLLRDARWGKRLGDIVVEDMLVIRNPLTGTPVARVTGEKALEFGVGREEQDLWALSSHQKYFAAFEAGKFADELIPVEVPPDRGGPFTVVQDESPRRDTSLEKLSQLPTVYGSPTVTAGNAPGLNDGAAAVVLCTREFVKESGLEPVGRVLTYVQVAGGPDESVFLPGVAIQRALRKLGLKPRDLKRIEINEAFAAMPLVSTKVLSEGDGDLLEYLRSITNVNGGAVAIGHPTGASGARLVMTLVYELRRIGGGLGAAAICGGYGQADAVVVEVG
jgi:acetyl-CoA C-acetyltransferase